ncbi:MAG: aminoglycoside phosphotransferase family protein [Bacteroidales bacterium]|nr:aminoglycoside phosphotransferase family protein [Bacteroidales bacterium]
MTDPMLQQIIPHFFVPGQVLELKPFGTGHINDTYLVTVPDGAYILQKVNKAVFDTPALVHNYSLLNQSVEVYQKEKGVPLTPQMLKTPGGQYHFVDDKGSAWRKVEFLAGSKSYDITADTSISFAAAEAYGKFQLFLNTLDAEEFQDTIPQFHHPANRMKQYELSLLNTSVDLLQKAAPEIEQVKKLRPVEREITRLLNSEKLPRRLSHYDTKLNNIIFHEGRPYVIDLDTVMSGTVLFDFGDMVRTFTSPAAEDEPDIEKTIFRMEHFEALTKGYLGVLKDELTDIEKQNLLLGAKAIIYEQALRFLSDYLNGNTYYKIAYPEHNLIRCRTQFKLLAEIAKSKWQITEVIHNVLTL